MTQSVLFLTRAVANTAAARWSSSEQKGYTGGSSQTPVPFETPKPSGHQHFTGETAPVTGTYRVVHAEHKLPLEVTVRSGCGFPCCAKCAVAVSFELLRPSQGSLPAGVMTLNMLPA